MENKVVHGNCYKVIKEIPYNSIDCVYIDIPYLIKQGGTSDMPLGQRHNKRNLELQEYDAKLLANIDKSKHNLLRVDKYHAKNREELVSMEDGIDYSIFDDLCRVMKKINIFIWCNKAQMFDIEKYFIGKKGCIFDLLVWAKENAIPTNHSLLNDLEYCLYFRESGVKINNQYELKSKWYCSPTNKKDKAKFYHPTIKPLAFVRNHILLATKPGDVVLDCFAGSGTTAVACKDTGRHYYLIERVKRHYQTIVDRLNNIDQTGQMSLITF